jgi:hypothetical protein
MSRIFHVRATRWLFAVAVLASSSIVGVLLAGPASAGATSEIEGVWSFNGGEVAIKPIPGGKFEGVVVAPTKFAECAHKVGEHMWTEITPQPDGSFWGKHQWLYEKSCEANPDLGPTAWRVLHTVTGSRYLEVCFSEPGKSQPTISPTGATAGVSYDCAQSSPTAALPVVVGSGSHTTSLSNGGEQISFAKTILLPNAHTCLRRGMLTIKIKDPKHDPLKQVVIRIKRRRIADIRGVKRLEHGIVLKGLPNDAYTLRFVATTVLDQKLTGRRTFHRCKQHTHTIKLNRAKQRGRR